MAQLECKMAQMNAQAAQAPVPPEGHERQMDRSNFQLLGDELPIGILVDGKLSKTFELRPYDMPAERKLAKLKKKCKSSPSFVARTLAAMIKSLGSVDFDAVPESHRTLMVSQMWLGDVMYIWFKLRMEAMGEELAVRMRCPACERKFQFVGDLEQTDCNVIMDPLDICWHHTLKHGLEVKGERIKPVVLQPPRWQAMMALEGAKLDQIDVKLALTRASVRQLGDKESNPVNFDSCTKYDLEKLQKVINDGVPGPELMLEFTCPHCEREGVHPINWDWDFFFSAASLS